MSEEQHRVSARLNAFLAARGLEPLDSALAARFEDYLSLLLRWNVRVNLTAIRDEEGILSRHFVESILCARALPAGIATLLDFGSGAGFPGIPIALCRPEIAVTLAESQGKKAAFLSEAVRQLGLAAKQTADRLDPEGAVDTEGGGGFNPRMTPAETVGALAPAGCSVYSGRAETLTAKFDCVTLRAVDKMERAVQSAAKLARPGGWLALMTTGKELDALKAGAVAEFTWRGALPLPGGDRLLALGERRISSPA
jgi:16S rRNA (guanine527-N7)-methyltransferase